MSNPSGVTYLRNTQHSDTELNAEAASRIEKIRHISARQLIEMLQNMFDGIDDSFFELANNARTNNEQNQFFEAMREIRIKRKSIESDFDESIRNLFSASNVLKKKDHHTEHKEIDFENLSLVNKEDLEETVAISSMSAKALSNFQGPLLQFQTRAANLYGASDLSTITAPLNPKDISNVFLSACSNLEINLKERLIVYKQFDRYVLSNLSYVLDEANQFLIKAGILPNLKSTIIKQKHTPKGEQASSPLNRTNSNFNSEQNHTQQTQNTLPELQSLLANARTYSKKYGSPTDNRTTPEDTHYLETQDLINLLTSIQKSTPPPNRDHKIVDIHSHLKNHIERSPKLREKETAFKQLDEDLINLVSMLFEFILEDYSLAAEIQVLISRLQIPILKVVIKDNSFFSTNKHPARKLLNSLAKAGLGWTGNQNNTQDILYQKIHYIVNTILEKYDGDINLFNTLNSEFEDFIIKEEKKSKIVEQRTKEAEKGLHKSKQAQKIVDTFIQKIITNDSIYLPAIIIETLTQGWSRAMFLAYLKDDKEHQWKKCCQTAQDLIWCLKPISSQKDRQNWISIAPKLLKELKRGLKDVSYHTNNLESTILEIRSILTSTFKQNTFNDQSNNATYNANNDIIPNPSDSAVDRQLAFNNTELERFTTEIDELSLGTWLEFKLTTNKSLRCKLTTILEETDSFIFVNRLGLKNLEKTREELADALFRKNAVILEQGLLIDRAMSAVTSSLKQKTSA
ncbi:MAG: hypothetical protein ACJAS1_001671 [Oleiphilaceae bacterium]|jgi:hypothetical protein